MVLARAAALAGLILCAAGANAQSVHPFAPPATAPMQEGRSVYGGPLTPPRLCDKLCERDASPCDPARFKQADGRCSPFGFTR